MIGMRAQEVTFCFNEADTTGKRLFEIRKKLEEIYKATGEFSRSWVAKSLKGKEGAMTYQGLKFMEENETEPQKIKVEALAALYNVHLSILYSQGNLPLTAVIGTQDDLDIFFEKWCEAWARPHILDPKARERLEEYGIEPPTDDAVEPELNADNSYQMDNICIEVSMRIYQVNTGAIVMNKNIHGKTEIAKEDIAPLQEVIQQQIKLVSNSYKRMRDLRDNI